MPLQADEFASGLYENAFRGAGCRIMTGAAVKDSNINMEENIEAVLLEDGMEIPCDFVVVATSVKPVSYTHLDVYKRQGHVFRFYV